MRSPQTIQGARRRPPRPRHEIFDLYWLFAARRHEAFERRLAGHPWPWTDDQILKRYKFCNVYRAADRVTQYLIRSVAYGDPTVSAADRLFQITAFRTFSSPATWDGVIARLGRAPTLEDLATGAFERALDSVKAERKRLYTGAFILCATKAFGFEEKHRNHVALFKHMFLEYAAAERICDASSLGQVVQILEAFPLIGQFMSYQIAIDLNYTTLLDFDENDYTQAGPGALRGLRKAFVDMGDYSPAEAIMWMVGQQDEQLSRLGIAFGGLWGRPLHAIDCQGLFCELDKYCREAAPHLQSNRSRIKSRFVPSSEPIALFFPPKWNLNAHIHQKTLPGFSVSPDPQSLLFDGDCMNQQAALRSLGSETRDELSRHVDLGM